MGKVQHPPTSQSHRDEQGQPLREVLCPNCGHLELWTDEECHDHGKCRLDTEPCWCEQSEH